MAGLPLPGYATASLHSPAHYGVSGKSFELMQWGVLLHSVSVR